jgi:hypothetical protein
LGKTPQKITLPEGKRALLVTKLKEPRSTVLAGSD